MDNGDLDYNHFPRPYHPPKSYALSGRIMLSAIVILFAVVVFIVCLHIYVRWYLLRARRRQNLRRRGRRRTHLVFYVEPNGPPAVRGLDAAVLGSLPVFSYPAETHPEALECAVCLSEFEENEKVRLLPKCNHSFHIECIDMWFHSHSTCPLCRSPVEPLPENLPDVVVPLGSEPFGTEPGPSSEMCAACQHEGLVSTAPSSSLSDRRKGFEVAIDVPRRNVSEDELGPSSPASQGLKSPASRLLSLKRILSMNRRASAVSPSGTGTSFGSVATELDIECGWSESTQQPSRVQTPR